MILLDTSGLLSALDESQRYHHECAAELDYLQRRPPRAGASKFYR